MMNTATAILNDLGISEQGAIRGFALLSASQKLAEFSQECTAFRNKYNLTFSEFEKSIKSRSDEIFTEEEDYMAWRFAEEGVAYWREKVERLKLEK
jgi:hypothetical protein